MESASVDDIIQLKSPFLSGVYFQQFIYRMDFYHSGIQAVLHLILICIDSIVWNELQELLVE